MDVDEAAAVVAAEEDVVDAMSEGDAVVSMVFSSHRPLHQLVVDVSVENELE